MDYQWVLAVSITVVGIVVGNLILNGIKGNKKASNEAFRLFVEETRKNFEVINKRLDKIEENLIILRR